LLAPVVVFLALLHSTQPFHKRTAIIDGRTIRFVKLVEEQIGRFQRPPGFDL
jgi:hypothetical protein